MPSSRVVVLVGLPASGKSTWLGASPDVLSSDALRVLLRGDAQDQTIHCAVFALLRHLLRERLRLGTAETFIDATNLTRRERRSWIKIAEWFGVPCDAVLFDVPLDECLRRNAARSRVVPADAMERMSKKLTPPELAEGFRSVQVVSSAAAPTPTAPPESAATPT